MKRKRIKNVDFNFPGAHLAITDWSQGGAASFENDAVLFKSNADAHLTEEQKKLLADVFEEEFKPLVMKADDLNKTSSSSPEGVVEDDNKLNDEGKTQEMSEDILKKLEALEAQNKTLQDALKSIEDKKVVEKVSTYKLPEEVSKQVSDLLVSLSAEQSGTVYKAFDAFVAAKESIVKAALEASPTDLAKALGAEVGETQKKDVPNQTETIKAHIKTIRKEAK